MLEKSRRFRGSIIFGDSTVLIVLIVLIAVLMVLIAVLIVLIGLIAANGANRANYGANRANFKLRHERAQWTEREGEAEDARQD